MKNDSPKKTEIFLLLALLCARRFDSDGAEEKHDSTEDFFAAFAGQLPTPEMEKIERLQSDYRGKSEAEKQKWLAQMEDFIGCDEPQVDGNVHWSHVEAALKNETAAIRKIIVPSLASAHRNRFIENLKETGDLRRRAALEKIIRTNFAEQFVAFRNLPDTTTFDRLSGASLARLVRVAGIREVALACVRIEAVETVGAFLRRFAAEDARQIAAQLNNFSKVPNERLLFAENLVQAALELEPQPSSMLDLLGIQLIGLLLCRAAPERIAYAKQKLPLEAAPKLNEIIETQCRETPVELQNTIGAEIERLAETIAKTKSDADK